MIVLQGISISKLQGLLKSSEYYSWISIGKVDKVCEFYHSGTGWSARQYVFLNNQSPSNVASVFKNDRSTSPKEILWNNMITMRGTFSDNKDTFSLHFKIDNIEQIEIAFIYAPNYQEIVSISGLKNYTLLSNNTCPENTMLTINWKKTEQFIKDNETLSLSISSNKFVPVFWNFDDDKLLQPFPIPHAFKRLRKSEYSNFVSFIFPEQKGFFNQGDIVCIKQLNLLAIVYGVYELNNIFYIWVKTEKQINNEEAESNDYGCIHLKDAPFVLTPFKQLKNMISLKKKSLLSILKNSRLLSIK